MIYGVTGKLGGGKSLHCVRWMLEQLRSGQPVCTNIELILDPTLRYTGLKLDDFKALYYMVDFDGEQADPWTLPTGDFRGTGDNRVLIVIDEAAEWFSGMTRSGEKEWSSWLRQSDKRGQDVVLIVQDPSLLARSGRCLVHRWQKCTDFGKAKIPIWGGIAMPPAIRNLISVKTFDANGRDVIETDRFFKEQSLFDCYRTAAMFGESAIASLQARAVANTDAVDVNFSKNHFSLCSSSFVWLVGAGMFLSWVFGGFSSNTIFRAMVDKDSSAIFKR